MRYAWIALCMIVLACGALAQQPNPVTNGGFEQVGPNGLPVDWSPVGDTVSITHDAHSGQNALLLDRNAAAIKASPETGLNRDWMPNSGKQGAMLAERKGAVRFWYKVPKAGPGAHLDFYMIAMSADPLENAGAMRVSYEVPEERYGDGQWHQGIVAYDFTDSPKCKWVHVAPRITGTDPAQWILDDIEYLPSAGALPSVDRFSLDEVKGHEGREAIVTVLMSNQGDKPLAGAAEIRLPEYLKSDDLASQPITGIAPKGNASLRWHVKGLRDREDKISLTVTGGMMPITRNLRLAPSLADVRLETKQFVLWPGKDTVVSLLVNNDGTVAATAIMASLKLPPEVEAIGATEGTIDLALPKTTTRLDFKVRAIKQSPSTMVAVSWDTGEKAKGQASAELVIGAPAPVSLVGTAVMPANVARVVCDSFEIIFPKNEFGYGIGWVYAKPGWQLVGAIPRLGRIVVKGREDHPVPLFASSFEARPTVVPLGMPQPAPAGTKVTGLTFHIDKRLLADARMTAPIDVTFASTGGSGLASVGRTITWQVSVPSTPAGSLLALDGPMMYVGEGSFGSDQDECLYPGLEWMESGEESSSALDISPTHPHRVRYVAHPHMVTIPMMAVRHEKLCAGLLWHSRTTWAAGANRPNLPADQSDTDRPSPVFASPDRFEGHASQVMGLFVPTVPAYVDPNTRVATKAWPAEGTGGPIKLIAAFYVNPDATSAMDVMNAWFDIYGIAPPRDLPHIAVDHKAAPVAGDARFRGYGPPEWLQQARRDGKWTEPTRDEWIQEIGWSSQAYLKTMWIEDKGGWISSKGGPALYETVGADPSFLYDCVLASRLTRDGDLRGQLQDRVAFLKRTHPGIVPLADDLNFNFGQPVRDLMNLTDHIAGVISSQPSDGGWKFHTRIEAGGVFKGMDYGRLGYEGEEAIGLTARNTFDILRCARMTGDAQMIAAGLKSLSYMDKFVVPRAAQVWEVPVHCPDILAGADACEAYLEAYRITGEKKYLDRAVYWEETGLPFIYQWDVDGFPFLRYGSIPVFGSSWFDCSWFGRPVQWNGLRWAYAALKLAEVDNTYPWRTLAEGVTISGMYQQGTGKDDLALWPDSIGATDASRSGWLFAPRMILTNVYKLMGYQPDPNTARVKAEGGTILINACGQVSGAKLDGKALRFTLEAAEPLATRIVVCGATEPETVKLDGQELPRRTSLDPGEVVGWMYHQWEGIIEISPGRPGRFEVEVSPVGFREVHLVSEAVTKIDFSFSDGDGGWRPLNDLTPFTFADGKLVTRSIGGDPYLVRTNCRVDGDSVARIHVRMSVSAGEKGEWYWTTTDGPDFAEDKTVKFAIQADGKMHDYLIDVGTNPMWRGKAITGVRLDPENGATGSDIQVDFVRGEK